jgi:hypothetical protein
MLKDSTLQGAKDTTIIIPHERLNEIDPFLRTYVKEEITKKKSETSVFYNLTVKTSKNAIISILFNPLTGEELFGEMQTSDLSMTNNTYNGQLRLTGTVKIVGDSYYRFYRNFKINNSQLIFRGKADNPDLDIHAVYLSKTGSSNTFLTSENQGVEIDLDITGTKLDPKLSLKLIENGVESEGTEANTDAISYLIFGVSRNNLPYQQASALSSVAGRQGINVVSGMLSTVLRDVAPFILSTEVNYTEGNVATGTDVRITSAVGDAIVKVGGRIFSGVENAEINVEYPLNKILNMDVSNNLVLEFSRTIDENGLNGGRTVYTGIKLSYKIHY